MKFWSSVPDVALSAYTIIPYVKKDAATDEESKTYNEFVYALKDGRKIRFASGDQDAAAAFAGGVEPPIHPWFQNAVLLPLPGSDPSGVDRSAEKTVRFANALAARFPECKVSCALVRTTAVPKSHRVPSDQRAKVEDHARSMKLSERLPSHSQVILVDDVLTRGATAIGAERVLRAAGVTSPVRLIAGAHTRFAEESPEGDVEWQVEWRFGASFPTKRKVKSHAPPRE